MLKTDQGLGHHRYKIIPRTLIFLFNSQDQVLLLRGAENKRLWAGLYNGIGGHIEAGEDIHEAAQRELLEETGITCDALVYCGQIMIDVEPGSGVGVFVFSGFTERQNLQDSEEGFLTWINMEEIERFPLVEDLPLLIPKIADFKPGDPPIIGKYTFDAEGNLEIFFR